MATEYDDTETDKPKVEFDMPSGDAEFDDLEVGEKTRVQATIRKEASGKYCLVAVNGMEVSGYSEDDDTDSEEEAEEEGAFAEMLEQEL